MSVKGIDSAIREMQQPLSEMDEPAADTAPASKRKLPCAFTNAIEQPVMKLPKTSESYVITRRNVGIRPSYKSCPMAQGENSHHSQEESLTGRIVRRFSDMFGAKKEMVEAAVNAAKYMDATTPEGQTPASILKKAENSVAERHASISSLDVLIEAAASRAKQEVQVDKSKTSDEQNLSMVDTALAFLLESADPKFADLRKSIANELQKGKYSDTLSQAAERAGKTKDAKSLLINSVKRNSVASNNGPPTLVTFPTDDQWRRRSTNSTHESLTSHRRSSLIQFSKEAIDHDGSWNQQKEFALTDKNRGDFGPHEKSTEKTIKSSKIPSTSPTIRKKRTKSLKFPERLREMLENDQSGFIHWTNDGKAFSITDTRKFENVVLSKYFKQAKFASFTRKLNRWGFRRVNGQPGTYRHNDFARGQRVVDKDLKQTDDHFNAINGTYSPGSDGDDNLDENSPMPKIPTHHVQVVSSSEYNKPGRNVIASHEMKPGLTRSRNPATLSPSPSDQQVSSFVSKISDVSVVSNPKVDHNNCQSNLSELHHVDRRPSYQFSLRGGHNVDRINIQFQSRTSKEGVKKLHYEHLLLDEQQQRQLEIQLEKTRLTRLERELFKASLQNPSRSLPQDPHLQILLQKRFHQPQAYQYHDPRGHGGNCRHSFERAPPSHVPPPSHHHRQVHEEHHNRHQQQYHKPLSAQMSPQVHHVPYHHHPHHLHQTVHPASHRNSIYKLC